MRFGSGFRKVSILSLFTLAAIALSTARADDLQQQLKDQYAGKILILRNFYDGPSLHYDTYGHIQGAWTTGDWTIDGVVRVEEVKVKSHGLTIQARRLHMGWLTSGFSDVADAKPANGKQKETRKLRIEADLAPDLPEADAAKAMLTRIFLTSQDQFADLVPDYWKPCVFTALTNNSGCHFSQEFAAAPGVAFTAGATETPESTGEQPPPRTTFRPGHGVTPPRVLHLSDPEFSEEARQAKYQGTMVLSLVVDSAGQAEDIRILRPIGVGLDRKAVESVSKWEFQPGTKEGEPVAVQIAVEVDFHLY